ncbi:MAG: hypothetical protein V4683_05810, partial [Bacteroidota bacterium]
MTTKSILTIFLLLFISFQIFAQNIPPGPANFRVTATECGKISLAWDDYPSGVEETEYQIFRSDDPNGLNFTQLSYINANVLQFLDQSYFLDASKTYQYKVRSLINNSYSEYSSIISTNFTCDIPQNLTITSAECGSVSISWSPITNPDLSGYTIYKFVSTGGTSGYYNNFATVGKTVNSYTDQNDDIGSGIKEYKIKARFNNETISNFSNTATSNSINCPTPIGLHVTNSTCGQISLTWDDFPAGINENGYKIWRYQQNQNSYNAVVVGTVPANTTTFIDNGPNHFTYLKPNTNYIYIIEAKFNNSYSPKSNEVLASFSCPVPTGLIVESSKCGEINLKWDDIAGNIEESRYTIYRRERLDGDYRLIGYVNPNVLSFKDTGGSDVFLSSNTYFYKISANFSTTESEYSNIVSSSFVCPIPDGIQLSNPNCENVTVTWNDLPAGINETGYEIYRSSPAYPEYYRLGTLGANVLSFLDEGQHLDGTDYTYKIKAKFGAALSDFSEPNTINYNCNSPSNFRIASTECGKIQLAWDDYNNNLNEYQYIISRSETINGYYSEIATINANTLTYTDNYYLSGGILYYYKIKARFGYNIVSELSAAINGSFSCPTPTGLQIVSSDCGVVNLTWNDLPSEYQESGYSIFKYEGDNIFNPRRIGELLANTTSFADTGFNASSGFSKANTVYFYFIAANFGNTFTPKSNTVSGSFSCPTPASPSYVSSTCGNIKISWADFPQNYSESGFEIFRATAANGYYGKVGQVGANIFEFEDTNNTNYSSERFYENQEYFYKIKGLFNSNTTELSIGNTQGSFNCLPPQNLRVTNINISGVTLAWDAGNPPSSLQAYWIERAENLEFENFEHEGSVNGNTYTFTHNDYFEDGKKYYYRVQWLTNRSVFSGYSNIVEFTYSAGPKFDGVTIQNAQIETANCNGVLLKWDDLPANLPETSYSVFRTSKPYYSESLEIRKIADLPANTTSYFDVGTAPINELLFGQPLEYYIVANMSNSLNKIESTHLSTTIYCGNDIILTTSQSQNCDPIVLNWTDLGPNFEETKFTIHRKNEAEENFRWIGEVNANVFTYTDNYSQYIKSNENIKYKIIGVKNYIESKASNELSVVPTCPIVYNLVTSATCNGIELSWDDLPSGTTENGFRIYRSLNNNESEFEYIDFVQANTLSYLDIKETLDKKTYYYKIAAVKSNFIMGFSNTVSTQINCYQVPIISVSNTSCGKITLAWSNNNPNEPSAFQLYRSTDGQNGEYKPVYSKTYPSYQNNSHADAAGDLIPYGYGNTVPLWLSSNTDYFYKVVQQIGNVFIESNVIAGQFICPNVPTGLQVSSINCNSVDLSWNPSDGHGKNSSGYEVFRSDNGINGEYIKQYNFSNYLGKTSFKDYPDINYSELVPGKTYYYKIRFYLDFIGSQFTAPVEVKLGTNMQTAQSGQWNDPAIWSCGRIPTSLDEILINNGHTITIG